MDWALVIVFHVMFQPSLSVLLTVEAEQPRYESEFRGDAVMGCRFQPALSNSVEYLKVTWHWITASSSREVYWVDDGVERLASQHPDYRGRVTFLREGLQEGWAKIKLSELRINDSGTYQCLVQTDEGADYKEIALSVTAPCKAVTKRLQKAAEGNEVLLSCQSEGYPESSVVWHDGHLRRIDPSTTAAEPTPEQLFKVTSEIRVRSSDKNNYTCSFSNEGSSATFHIPDELPIPPAKNDALFIALAVGVIIAVSVAVLIYRRRKGSSTPSLRNVYVDVQDRTVSSAECHPVKLQALLPEAGETLFLEGPPGIVKTTLAHILVSSRTEGPTHPPPPVSSISAPSDFYYVSTAAKVKSDLFQEITQLNGKDISRG